MNYCLCYISRKSGSISKKGIESIIKTSKAHNSKNKITGVLIEYENHFLQHIEGDAIIIYELFQRIQKDDRHKKINLLQYAPIEKRLFNNWSMLYRNIEELKSNKIKEYSLFKDSLNEIIANKAFWKGIKTIEMMSNVLQTTS